jgi:hypothetical protein
MVSQSAAPFYTKSMTYSSEIIAISLANKPAPPLRNHRLG